MSYDLYITDRRIPDDYLDDVCVDGDRMRDVEKGMRFCYTYNLSGFFSDFAVNPKRDLDGHACREVASLIGEALDEMDTIGLDELSKKYDPANGWGSVYGAAAWLGRIRDYCVKHPDFILRERS